MFNHFLMLCDPGYFNASVSFLRLLSFFKLGVRKFHFPKYKNIFRMGFYSFRARKVSSWIFLFLGLESSVFRNTLRLTCIRNFLILLLECSISRNIRSFSRVGSFYFLSSESSVSWNIRRFFKFLFPKIQESSVSWNIKNFFEAFLSRNKNVFVASVS